MFCPLYGIEISECFEAELCPDEMLEMCMILNGTTLPEEQDCGSDEEDLLEDVCSNLPVVRCPICNQLVREDELEEGKHCPMCFEDLSNLVDEAWTEMEE